MTSGSTRNIWGVVVTYQPDLVRLQRVLDSVRPQVDGLILVDNGSNGEVTRWLRDPDMHAAFTLVTHGENRGLAAGHNTGIVEARSHGATHVLLLDQDSIASATMVRALASALDKLNEVSSRIAAVGPCYVDRATGHASSFVRFGPIESKLMAGGSAAGEVVRADFLISSGSLISIATLDVVGPMEEGLFVDHIDTEWCLRAAQKGYQAFGVSDATMEHELGDGGRRVWLGRWRRVAYHSPLRHYYIFRNSALLHQRRYAPRRWRRNDRVRLFLIAVYFGVFGPERRAQAKMMVRGWRDGRAGRVGRFKP